MRRQSLFRLRNQGSVLIVSLWAFAVLSILSLALANLVFQQIRFTKFYTRQALSLPLAKTEVALSLIELGYDATPEYDSFKELSEARKRELCDNVKYHYYYVDKKIDGEQEKIIDESALININLASNIVLERLPGLDEELAEKIVTSNRRPFKFKEEVLLIEGIDKDAFNQFKDLVTVNTAGKININTVSAEVLSALGLEEDLIEIIMRYRREYEGKDGEPDSEDDGAFTNQGTILSDLEEFYGLGTSQQLAFLSIIGQLSVKSDYLRLNVVPEIKGSAGTRYSILIRPADKKVLSWREF